VTRNDRPAQHVLFDASEDLDGERKTMEKILRESETDAAVCAVLWPD